MDFNWQNGKQTKSRRGAPRFSGFRTVQVPAGGADACVGGTCLQQIFSSQRNELPEWEDNKLSVQGISPRQGPFFMPIRCSCTKAFQTGQLKNFLTPGSPPEGDLTDIPVIFTCWTLFSSWAKRYLPLFGTCVYPLCLESLRGEQDCKTMHQKNPEDLSLSDCSTSVHLEDFTLHQDLESLLSTRESPKQNQVIPIKQQFLQAFSMPGML